MQHGRYAETCSFPASCLVELALSSFIPIRILCATRRIYTLAYARSNMSPVQRRTIELRSDATFDGDLPQNEIDIKVRRKQRATEPWLLKESCNCRRIITQRCNHFSPTFRPLRMGCLRVAWVWNASSESTVTMTAGSRLLIPSQIAHSRLCHFWTFTC